MNGSNHGYPRVAVRRECVSTVAPRAGSAAARMRPLPSTLPPSLGNDPSRRKGIEATVVVLERIAEALYHPAEDCHTRVEAHLLEARVTRGTSAASSPGYVTFVPLTTANGVMRCGAARLALVMWATCAPRAVNASATRKR